ncbi:MAG: hypothetical protein HY291_21945 [Planctomycetes bacterium]|nr:hypothetical protein [Planctomycetota bacterium]
MPPNLSVPAPQTGPRTPEGKSTSALNSARHGLRAKKKLAQIFGEAAFAELLDLCLEELRPLGLIETLQVRNIAQSAALCALGERALRALLHGVTTDKESLHLLLSHPMETVSAQRLVHVHSLNRLLKDFHTNRNLALEAPTRPSVIARHEQRANELCDELRSEVACAVLLRVAFEDGGYPLAPGDPLPPEDHLPANRYHLIYRRTFLEGTRLYVPSALRAAVLLLHEPQFPLGLLGTRVGIRRPETLRDLCRRIHARDQANDDRVLRELRRRMQPDP